MRQILTLLICYICLTGQAIAIPDKERATTCEVGIASWYGKPFHGRITKSGEVYDTYKLTAAHNRLPMGTVVEVTNLKNNKKVIVKINDTGSFTKKYKRTIDLSYQAAVQLDYKEEGITSVKVCIK